MKKNLILTKERHITNATPLKVWTILTDNQWIEQWLGVQMITDWKPGSPIAFTFVYKDKEVKDKGPCFNLNREKSFPILIGVFFQLQKIVRKTIRRSR